VDKVGVLDAWFAEINGALEQAKDKDLPYTLDQVKRRIEALQAEVEAVLSAPPPKPKEEKKEAPKDAAPAEGKKEAASPADGAKGDAEMKDEGQPEAAASEQDGEQKPADVEMDAGATGANAQAQE